MAISYRPLWVQLAYKGLQKTDIIKRAHLTTNVMASMGKNKVISIKNIEKICIALNCSPNEVFEFVDSDKIERGEINELD